MRNCSRLKKADNYSNTLLPSWAVIVESFRWTDVASSWLFSVQSEFYERSDLKTYTMIMDFNMSYTHYQADEKHCSIISFLI